MVDRLISRGLSVVVLGMIAFMVGGTILLAYHSLFELVSRNWIAGSLQIAAAFPLGLASMLLMRHKDDLMDK